MLHPHMPFPPERMPCSIATLVQDGLRGSVTPSRSRLAAHLGAHGSQLLLALAQDLLSLGLTGCRGCPHLCQLGLVLQHRQCQSTAGTMGKPAPCLLKVTTGSLSSIGRSRQWVSTRQQSSYGSNGSTHLGQQQHRRTELPHARSCIATAVHSSAGGPHLPPYNGAGRPMLLRKPRAYQG